MIIIPAIAKAIVVVGILASGVNTVVGNGVTPMASDGLHTLATTGWANDYAAEIGGVAYDKTGGKPGMFTYDISSVELNAARALLNKGEFLAPHFSKGADGTITVMVAPHLLVDGAVVKGAGPDDNFIVVANGNADRYDYSKDIAEVSMDM